MAEEKKPRRVRSQGARNRAKGHDAERYYAKVFRELHPRFEKCKTSREASALADKSGIDLCFTDPFNVQVKAGTQRGLNVSRELMKIREEVHNNFPSHYPEHTNISILIHRKAVGAGRKRNEFDEIVSMTFKDFLRILEITKL